MLSSLARKKNRTEDMPTFPCLGGNKKEKYEKTMTRAGVFATFRKRRPRKGRGHQQPSSRPRSSKRAASIVPSTALAKAHVDVESFFVCVFST